MTEDARLGVVLRDGQRVGLRYNRHLAHPPERVWSALTESERLQHWMPCDIVGDRVEGADIELPFWPPVAEKYGLGEASLLGTIITWRPPYLFEWTWDGDHLRFELEPTDRGTHLTFTTWFGEGLKGPTPDAADVKRATQTAAGYHICFDRMELLLEGGASGTVADVDPTSTEQQYEESVRDALGFSGLGESDSTSR